MHPELLAELLPELPLLNCLSRIVSQSASCETMEEATADGAAAEGTTSRQTLEQLHAERGSCACAACVWADQWILTPVILGAIAPKL